MEVEWHKCARWDLEQLQSIDASWKLLAKVQKVCDVQELTPGAFDCETDLLVDLFAVKELEQIVIAEVSLLVVVKVDQEGLNNLIDCDLRYFLGLDASLQVSEDPLDGLESIDKGDRIHHLNLSAAFFRCDN